MNTMIVSDSCRAEIRGLEEMLLSMPEGHVIERLSLEARLRNARDFLRDLKHAGNPEKE